MCDDATAHDKFTLEHPIVKRFRLGGLGKNLTVLRDTWGFNIKFKFYNPPKKHLLARFHVF